jgi:hypothetical protein
MIFILAIANICFLKFQAVYALYPQLQYAGMGDMTAVCSIAYPATPSSREEDHNSTVIDNRGFGRGCCSRQKQLASHPHLRKSTGRIHSMLLRVGSGHMVGVGSCRSSGCTPMSQKRVLLLTSPICMQYNQ